MAYTTPDLNDYLPGEPLTSAKALLMVENPIAIANGDDDAPRVSPKAWGHTPFLGGAIGTVVLSDFSDYGGVFFEVKYSNSAGGSTTMTIELSDDGATYAASANIATVAGSSDGAATVFCDFATGAVKSVWFGTSGAGSYDLTAGVPGGGVSHIRISAAGTTTTTMGVLALANAGTVA